MTNLKTHIEKLVGEHHIKKLQILEQEKKELQEMETEAKAVTEEEKDIAEHFEKEYKPEE